LSRRISSRNGEQIPYQIESNKKQKSVLRLYSPRYQQSANAKESLDFVFNQVFDQDASQEEVFEGVAKNVVLK
jgi:hypothetical protein